MPIEGTGNGEPLRLTPELNVLDSPRSSPISSRYDAEIATTCWYAPGARAIVRSVAHTRYLGRSVVELIEARLRH